MQNPFFSGRVVAENRPPSLIDGSLQGPVFDTETESLLAPEIPRDSQVVESIHAHWWLQQCSHEACSI